MFCPVASTHVFPPYDTINEQIYEIIDCLLDQTASFKLMFACSLLRNRQQNWVSVNFTVTVFSLSQTSHLRKRTLKLSLHLSPPHRLSPFSTTFFLFSRSLTTSSSVLTLPTRNPSGTFSLHLHLPPALTSPFCQHYSLLGLLQ